MCKLATHEFPHGSLWAGVIATRQKLSHSFCAILKKLIPVEALSLHKFLRHLVSLENRLEELFLGKSR